MAFDFEKFKKEAYYIKWEKSLKNRKHPVFRFYNENNGYICEVRYGGKDANALQRGFWSHTEKGYDYFKSITGGWIDYKTNENLIKLIKYSLISSKEGHEEAISVLEKNIEELKKYANKNFI